MIVADIQVVVLKAHFHRPHPLPTYLRRKSFPGSLRLRPRDKPIETPSLLLELRPQPLFLMETQTNRSYCYQTVSWVYREVELEPLPLLPRTRKVKDLSHLRPSHPARVLLQPQQILRRRLHSHFQLDSSTLFHRTLRSTIHYASNAHKSCRTRFKTSSRKFNVNEMLTLDSKDGGLQLLPKLKASGLW
jgi:hypothetical protein